MSDAGQQITVYNGYGAPDTQATVLVPQRHGMEGPKVSVIMPVYNAERYLRECLDSVLAQTLRDIEIICVDDGSTDSSLEILQEYAARDDRFIILTQQNHFAGVARNAGMVLATGEFLSFLDSDDVFRPPMLEDAYTAAKRDGADVAVFGYDECNETLDEVLATRTIDPAYVPHSPVRFKQLGRKGFMLTSPNAWSKLFRRSLVMGKQVRFVSTRCANDFTFVCTMLALAGKISLSDKVYVSYRSIQKSNISSTRVKYFAAYIQALTALKGNLIRHGVFRKAKTSFWLLAAITCHYELGFCQTTNEREGKLAEFTRTAGKGVADIVRSWSCPGAKKLFYRLRGMLGLIISWPSKTR